MTLPVPAPTPQPVSKRAGKLERAAFNDSEAKERDRFRARNGYYYRELERFFRFVVPPGARVLEVGCSTGDLLSAVQPTFGVGIDISAATLEIARTKHPALTFLQQDVEAIGPDFVEKVGGPFDYVIVSDTMGELDDIWQAFRALQCVCHPSTRIIVSYFNHLWEPLVRISERIGMKMPQKVQSWLSVADIRGILELAGYETVRSGLRTLVPKGIPGIAWLANRLLAQLPGVRRLCLVEYVIARPRPGPVNAQAPSVTVVVPTRNEVGNVDDIVAGIPALGSRTEILFVDGSSTDGTTEQIEENIRRFRGSKEIRLLHQVPPRKSEDDMIASGLISARGKMLKLGKGDAVRKGFEAATGEIVLILDADLTVPPEDLPKFVAALTERRGEMVNGTRLVYPMEEKAMRPLNLLANVFFSAVFTWLLEQRIKDTLCGTKALWKSDYLRIKAGRSTFGDFDPFGDFDLLFGAAKLGLKIVEVPIRYRERIHGEVKIERFKHGLLLVRMCAIAFRKLKMV